MNTFLKEKKVTNLKQKGLVLAVSAILTSMVTTSVAQASDIQIYQNPSATSYPIIMLAIDNSPSMGAQDVTYNGVKTSRLNALQKSLVDALNARNTDNTFKIPDRAYIGVAVFATASRSKVLVEAKRLDAIVSDTTTHRQDLITKINAISTSGTSTPTSTLFAEAYAYLLGSRTDSPNNVTTMSTTTYTHANVQGMDLAPTGTVSASKYNAPIENLSSEADKQCSTQGIFFLTDGAPTQIVPPQTELLLKNVVANANIRNAADTANLTDNIITGADADVPKVYYNYENANSNSVGNGEFYEMKLGSALNASQISTNYTVGEKYQDRNGWSYIANLVRAAANAPKTSKKRIYLSTVGYSPMLTKAASEICTLNGNGVEEHCYIPDNIIDAERTVGNAAYKSNSYFRQYANTLNANALKMLGDKLGQGDTYGTTEPIGGYTYADTGEKVQNALLKFVRDIDAGSFESASFGTYVVPADPLATTSSYNYVFAPQFQPKVSGTGASVQSTQQLWVGNLKKYTLNSSGVLVDRGGTTLLNSRGAVVANTRDFWNASATTTDKDGDSALKGGLSSQLTMPNAAPAALNTVTNVTDIQTRPLYINATIPIAITDTNKNKVVAATSLTKLTTEEVLNATALDTTKTGWRQNTYQPYLLSALGYKLNKTYLDALPEGYKWDAVNKVKNLNVMQQMGGVLHSDPLLVTLEGKYDTTTGAILANTTAAPNNRKDYIVTGTMQGLLHMVDQSTGKEAFAFLPNEIVQDTARRDALLDASNTQTTTTHPYYGIDAPWASWVEYKVNTTSNKFEANIANIYGGMRMGGSSYYGLNVKDPTDPKFLFQIDPVSGTIKSATSAANTTTANAAIQAMGQSWSKPTLAKIRFGNSVKKVMIVGGGYDSVYESYTYQPTSVTTASPNKGAGVYIFDATTGALLWNVRAGANNVATTDVKNANLKYSVVSEIKAFDRDADGLVDNLYFGDLGGQVFRVDLNNTYGTTAANFGRVNRLADFSALNQRFYEMPSLSIHERNGSRFGAIGIASGNRSFPLNVSNGADNRIYALYDYDIASTNLFESTFTKTSDITEANMLNWADIVSTNVADLATNTKKGWYYVLRKTGTSNETANTGTVKSLNGYLVVGNTAKFSDFYVSLYNPNHASSQQPDACTGGITGSSITKRLCLPYGVCGDIDDSSTSFNPDDRENNGDPKDGIGDVQAGGFVSGGQNLITLVPGNGRNYKTTKVFQSSNWYER